MMALVVSLGPSPAMIFQVRKWLIRARRIPTPDAITPAYSASFQRSHAGMSQPPPSRPVASASSSAMNR
ncbi:hypothetical protein D9M71_804820 [compost metagenome]